MKSVKRMICIGTLNFYFVFRTAIKFNQIFDFKLRQIVLQLRKQFE